MRKSKPAICCVGYNRPESMKRLLESIGKAYYEDENIVLIISIDKDKEGKSDEVVEIARDFEWVHGEKRVIPHEENMGLKRHILECGDYSIEYGAVIILEDDIMVSPGFYGYIKEAFQFYAEDSRVFGVALYSQKWMYSYQLEITPAFNGAECFLIKGDITHGQGWTGSRWKEYKTWLEKKPDYHYDSRIRKGIYSWDSATSWAKALNWYLVEEGKYFAVPYVSYSTNGSDAGVHVSAGSDQMQVPLSFKITGYKFFPFEKLVRYDNFLEREDDFTDKIYGIPISEICIDFNGVKYDYSGYNYLLTVRKLKYEAAASFGMHMEPIEINVIYDMPGEHVRLYKIPKDYRPDKRIDDGKEYICCGRVFRALNRYSFVSLVKGILVKMKNRLFMRFPF